MKKIHTADLTEKLVDHVETETGVLSIRPVADTKASIFYLVVSHMVTLKTFETPVVNSRRALHGQLEGLLLGYNYGVNTEQEHAKRKADADLQKAMAARAQQEEQDRKYALLERRKFLRSMLIGRDDNVMFEAESTRSNRIRLYNRLIDKAIAKGWLVKDAANTPENAEVWVANAQYACLLRNEGLI